MKAAAQSIKSCRFYMPLMSTSNIRMANVISKFICDMVVAWDFQIHKSLELTRYSAKNKNHP